MISHLTDRERNRLYIKLNKSNKSLFERYNELRRNYEAFRDYKRWFYRCINPDKIEKDIDYYIERHERKHFNE